MSKSAQITNADAAVPRKIADAIRILDKRAPVDDAPASAAAAGREGTIAWSSTHLYVCVAADTWKRVAIATW